MVVRQYFFLILGLYSSQYDAVDVCCPCTQKPFMFVGAPSSGTRFFFQCWYDSLVSHFEILDYVDKTLPVLGDHASFDRCCDMDSPPDLPESYVSVLKMLPHFSHVCALEKVRNTNPHKNIQNQPYGSCRLKMLEVALNWKLPLIGLIRDPREVLKSETFQGGFKLLWGRNTLPFCEKQLLLIVEYYNALLELQAKYAHVQVVSYEALKVNTSSTLQRVSEITGVNISRANANQAVGRCNTHAQKQQHSKAVRSHGAYTTYYTPEQQAIMNTILRSYGSHALLTFLEHHGVAIPEAQLVKDTITLDMRCGDAADTSYGGDAAGTSSILPVISSYGIVCVVVILLVLVLLCRRLGRGFKGMSSA